MARLWTNTNGQNISLGNLTGPSGALSFSIWMRPTDVTGVDLMAAMYDTSPSDAYFQCFLNNPGRIQCRIHQVRDVDFVGRRTGDNAVSNATWHHVGFVWDGGTTNAAIKVYVDGVQVDTTDDGAGTFTAASSGSIGYLIGDQNPGDETTPFNGRLAEHAAWSVALTANEMAALAKGKSPLDVRRLSIFGGYHPIYGLNSPEPDLSGNGNNGTVNGTLVLANHAPVIPYSARFWGHGPLVEAAVAGVPGGAYYQYYIRNVAAA